MPHQLFPHQAQALDEVKRHLVNKINVLAVMMPTGSGKTEVAAQVMRGAVAKGNRAYFVVDSLELVDQAVQRFTAEGLPVGVIQGQHILTDYRQPVQVATIQTLRRRWAEIAEAHKPAVVVIDEAHVLHQAHEEIITECRAKGVPVLGLSATPWRRGLGQVFDGVVVGATTAELTAQGYLCPATCYAPYVPDLTGVKTRHDGDWQEDALAEFMGDAKIVGDVVSSWFSLAEGRQTLVFAANVAHSRALCDAFQRAGVPAAHIDGYERDEARRQQVIKDFRAGKLRVLCNVAVLTKGFDAPETSCLVIARPTKSLMLHYQIMGRGLRTAPGKTDCLILDHAGNCLRNGEPTDPVPTHLDDGKSQHKLDRRQRDKRDPVKKPCLACGFLSSKHECPKCGFKPEKREDVVIKDGELYEIGSQTRPRWSREGLETLYAELLGHAQLKGYKKGWAWHTCKEFTGTAPHNTRQIQPRHPSSRTLGIIKHMRIKKAKAAEKARREVTA